MKTELPDVTACPKCGGPFHVKARTVCNAMLPNAHDEPEWKCPKCGHPELEQWLTAAGGDHHWPASKFQSS